MQVLVNLLTNAADALEDRSAHRPAEVTISAAVEGQEVVLRVEDTGPGIAPSAFGKIFDAFFTTKEPGRGTGLGLALSREYVERAGGKLLASNRAEGGACFTLRLPIEAPRTLGSEDRANPEQTVRGRRPHLAVARVA